MLPLCPAVHKLHTLCRSSYASIITVGRGLRRMKEMSSSGILVYTQACAYAQFGSGLLLGVWTKGKKYQNRNKQKNRSFRTYYG